MSGREAMKTFPCLVLVLLLLLDRNSSAAADPPPADAVAFTRDIAPILVQKCQGCHGPDKPKGGYRLDTFDRLMKPGDGGTAPLVPGEDRKSVV